MRMTTKETVVILGIRDLAKLRYGAMRIRIWIITRVTLLLRQMWHWEISWGWKWYRL